MHSEKNYLYFRKTNFLTLRLKNLYFFRRKLSLYFGKQTPRKIYLYFSKRNFLIFQETETVFLYFKKATFQAREIKKPAL